MTGGLHSLIQLLVLCIVQMQFATTAKAETIFAFNGNDGAISLSNIQFDRRFKPLVSDGLEVNDNSDKRPKRPSTRDYLAKARFDEVVQQTAAAYGLNSALLHAVISVESGYDPNARSRKGAAGLMQLMPGTAKRYGVFNVLDPIQNLQGGAQYLRDLLKLFNSDLSLALAAYNAGENAVAKYGNQLPPFRETTEYVPRVMDYYRKYQANIISQE